MLRRIGILSVIVTGFILLSACEKPETFTIYDGQSDSDSVKFQNIVTQFMIENGTGNHIKYISENSQDAQANLLAGKVDIVHMLGQNSIATNTQIDKVGNYFISKNLAKNFPEIVSLLSKIKINDETVTECLKWAEEKGTDFDGATLYFLLNYQSVWKTWVDEATFKSIKAAMNQVIEKSDLKNEF